MRTVKVKYDCMQPHNGKPCGNAVTLTLEIRGTVCEFPRLRCARCPGFPLMKQYEPEEVGESRLVVPGVKVPTDLWRNA